MPNLANPIRDFQDGRRTVLHPGEADPLGSLSTDLDNWADAYDALAEEAAAWREAYQALKAYTHLNDGENARRYRAARERLKELKLK